jgi:hypothetical protein
VLAYGQSSDRELKLPYDFEVDDDADYIELEEGKKKPPAPAPSARPAPAAPADPRQARPDPRDDLRYDERPAPEPRRDQRHDQRNDRLITGNPQRRGDECRGARPGDYVHAQDLYTKIFEQNGRIYVTYPVFTLEQTQRRGRAPRNDHPQVVQVWEDREVFYPAQEIPLLDQFGRPLYELDPWGRPVRVITQCIPARVVVEKVLVYKNVDQGHVQEFEVGEDCVALPYLRTAEVVGARNVFEAQEMVRRNGRSLKRSAGNATREATPRHLGPLSSNDPGLNSK